jgi:glucose/arabinose dehydrogenase
MLRMKLARLAALITLLVPSAALAQQFQSSAGALRVDTVASGLAHPWGLQFLPDGRMLVTERPGRMRIVSRDGKLSPPVQGVPQVFARGQGGLLDVALDRNFAQNRTIYFSYAEPYQGGARTALARAVLDAGERPSLTETKLIYQQPGPPSPSNHFAGRIVQARDGNLFLSTGDHFIDRDKAQTLDTGLGKIIRITTDGGAPRDNPFVGRNNALPEVWAYGVRNPQGMALHPQTGALWMNDHGPRGGDEVNIIEKGKNYGWPVIGYGVDYSGAKIHEATQKEGMEQPLKYWVPSFAPSGMAFYTADLFPAWKGNIFIGGLRSQILMRLEVDGSKVGREERLLADLGQRIRDVRQGPDGALYLLTDQQDGRILRVTPAR